MILFYTLLVLTGVAIGFFFCYILIGVRELRRKAEMYDASQSPKSISRDNAPS